MAGTFKNVPSPNFNARAANINLEYIVLHYTGMPTAEAALERMCDPAAKVSAHYLVHEDGEIITLVDERNRAWHAGKSSWHGISDINSASIGIEIVNPGHEHGYRAFPPAQIDATKKLLRDITARHHLNPKTALLAHSDIAPARKEDPGEFFPWAELAQEGLGLWPLPEPGDYADFTHDETHALLNAVGYDIQQPDKALLAFQRRYYPQQLTAQPDGETVARLRALKRLVG